MNDLFPLKEYRGYEAKSTAVKAKMTNATALVIDTQFDGATAQAVATAYLAATRNPAQTYTFTVEETLSLNDMVTAVRRIALTYGSINGYVGKITSFRVDRATGQTTVTMRGVS